MDTISDVNHEVIKLWEKWAKKLKKIDNDLKVPLIYPDLKPRGLLFIGINPSFNLKYLRKAVADPIEFYRWENRKAFKSEIQKFLKIEESSRGKYPFFKIFEEIAGETLEDPSKWDHIDLFFNRATRQKDFEENILNRKDLAKFVDAQLELSAKLINYVCPKVIIIANARASKEFEEKLNANFPLTWKEEYGYHMTTLQGRSIPVFLASMLTGQRAMDVYSRQRLVWHIKQALLRQSKHK